MTTVPWLLCRLVLPWSIKLLRPEDVDVAVEGRSVVVVLVGAIGMVEATAVATAGFAGSPRDEPGLIAEPVAVVGVAVAARVELDDRV